MPDPKHPDTKQQDERKQQGSQESDPHSGQKKSPGGGKENLGNFAKDPDRSPKAGEKGGRSHS